MNKRRGKHPFIEGLEITDIAAEGKSMGRYNDRVVFVPMTIPGDVVDVQIRRRRRRFMEGYVVNYVKRSPMNIEPVCEHFGVCGGCKWQNLPYKEQLKFKTEQVKDQLERIAKVELPEIEPALPSEKTEFYRNKLEFSFSDSRWLTTEEIESGKEIEDREALGFHIPGMWDKILDIKKCWLQADPSNQIRLSLKKFCIEKGYEFYNRHQHSGMMRGVVIRTSSTGEGMIIVVFAQDERETIEAVMEHLKEQFPEIVSFMYVINDKQNDSIGDLDHLLYSGRDHIFEEMEGLSFKVGAKSFYQTNSEQAYSLYKVAREFAEIQPADTVYDLYTGIGTIANFVAKGAKRVIGIEYVPEAIEDAKYNSKLNDIENCRFFAGDMKDVLSDEFIEEQGHPDVIILDPPRAGIHPDVAETILRAAPERIVYVSCNPATQARDIALLDEQYRVTRVKPVDMFPHTHHVENVVRLEKRN